MEERIHGHVRVHVYVRFGRTFLLLLQGGKSPLHNYHSFSSSSSSSFFLLVIISRLRYCMGNPSQSLLEVGNR